MPGQTISLKWPENEEQPAKVREGQLVLALVSNDCTVLDQDDLVKAQANASPTIANPPKLFERLTQLQNEGKAIYQQVSPPTKKVENPS